MLSICFVSQEYPEETGWGGIGTYTFEMAHALARAGHRVVVVARALDHRQHYVESDGVEVYRVLPSLDLSSRPFVWRLNRYWEGYRLAVALQLKRILSDHQVDIIEAPELHAEPLLHSLVHGKPPLVVRLHSGSNVVAAFEPNHSNGSKFDTRLENWLMKKANRITSPSHALLKSTNPTNGLRHATVIPNPVDVDHFKPAAKTHSVINIICVGRPRHLKGIHILAQAIPLVWNRVPEAQFTFVPASMGKSGELPQDAYNEILGSLIADDRIRVVAPVSRSEMPQVYHDATLCIVPSLWEGFGYVCAEAMACGLPVIASRIGGLAEIVEDGKSGELFEPGDANELARTIVRLIGDGERRRELGAAARHRIVEEFSSPVIASQMAALYQEVVREVVR